MNLIKQFVERLISCLLVMAGMVLIASARIGNNPSNIFYIIGITLIFFPLFFWMEIRSKEPYLIEVKNGN